VTFVQACSTTTHQTRGQLTDNIASEERTDGPTVPANIRFSACADVRVHDQLRPL